MWAGVPDRGPAYYGGPPRESGYTSHMPKTKALVSVAQMNRLDVKDLDEKAQFESLLTHFLQRLNMLRR